MSKERLQPISLHQEMQRSYLEYAMSVIVGRALPDARDGLKPVQRRILFAMHELGLTPDRPFRKCARVVGDVLGKYHPHGDQAVYDALVRLVQNFSSRYPVLDGHGNFGSIDDDPPAAMRYTETRLSSIAHEAILSEIEGNTVDFNPNFDGSQQEPEVLPAQLPFLILNGCSGIAVGMATNIPPHNINEIIDGLIQLIKKPEIKEEDLINIIPGPDFPTGGEILLGSGTKETYIKGKGSIPMRGISHIEEITPGKGKHRKKGIIITELPYQVNKSNWIEKLADLVNNGKIDGIADIRDESDRDGMRIVIELRRDADSEKTQKLLYDKTSLQNNFSATLLALVNGQPKQLSLKEYLLIFLEYRELTIQRRTKNKLKKTILRLEIVEGLIKALKNLRKVINLLENAADAADAKTKIMEELFLNEKQSEGILSMPLRKLTNLETQSLYNELDVLKTIKNDLQKLLDNRNVLLKLMISEFKTLQKKFGSKRKTRLKEGGDELLAERNANLRPNAELQRKKAFEGLPKDGTLLIQSNNEVKILNPRILKKLNLNESCIIGEEPSPANIIWPIIKNPKIIAITNTGKIALLKWEFAGLQPGKINKFLPSGLEGEIVISLIPLVNNNNLSLGLLSSDGRFKRININEILDLSGRATTILKLKNNVSLKSAFLCHCEGFLIIVSDIGRIIKLRVNDITMPTMGKLAQGPILMKMLPGENIISGLSIAKDKACDLIFVTQNGNVIKKYSDDINIYDKGDMGTIAIELIENKNKKERVVSMYNGKYLSSVITNTGRNGRVSSNQLINIEYNIKQNKAFNLNSGESIESIIPLIEEKNYSFFD
ncbi:DNA gyrase/topoisomerase IV subunit A [Prochlorococcus marinus]|uniref:DNA gyrase/topoisomerase IV subunit A n=1 Tax=Prochlorococcus marinus TaxID=1219 RepID=UPI0022B365F5|nr:DNA topoisomerase (ATP-hydrolyzing) [Prochlorococcus marinus]